MTAPTMEKLCECLNIPIYELFNAEHLQPTPELVGKLHTMINDVKDDSDKIAILFKIVRDIVRE